MAAMNKRRRGMEKVPMASDSEGEGQGSDGEVKQGGEAGHASKKARTASNGQSNGNSNVTKKAKKDEEDHIDVQEGGDSSDESKGKGNTVKAKGAPGTDRKDSPEGGGVAGKEANKHKNAYEVKGKVASAEVAAKVDANPPLDILMDLQTAKGVKKAEKGESVVYWMRMEDLRCTSKPFACGAEVSGQT